MRQLGRLPHILWGMGEFRVSRSRHIAAPLEQVHGFVDDFHEWVHWSPWEGPDPQLRRTYSGAARGVGAQYEWAGDKKAGSGHMEILDATPHEITVALTFTAPFESENTSYFAFSPSADGRTDVTWTMTGPQSAPQRVLFTLIRMNAKVAKDFDNGLAALDAAATGRAPAGA